jgi:multicomponent Na+:H+ antiporter subunit F
MSGGEIVWTPWLAAVVALLPALAVPVAAAMRRDAGQRLVAVQLATALAAVILVLMSFAFDQPSFMDLALTLTLLSLPGTLLLALFLERWL